MKLNKSICKKYAKFLFPILCIILIVALWLPHQQERIALNKLNASNEFSNYPKYAAFYIGQAIPANIHVNLDDKSPNKYDSWLTKTGIDDTKGIITTFPKTVYQVLENAGNHYFTISLAPETETKTLPDYRYRLFDANGNEIASSNNKIVNGEKLFTGLTSSGGNSSAIVATVPNREDAKQYDLHFAIAHEGTITTGTRPNGNGGAICDNGDFSWIRNNNTVITENKNGDTISEYPLLEATNLGQLRSGHISCDTPNKTLRLRSEDNITVYSWEYRDGAYHPLPTRQYPNGAIKPKFPVQVFTDYLIGIEADGTITQVWFADGHITRIQPFANPLQEEKIVIHAANFTPKQALITYHYLNSKTEKLMTVDLRYPDCKSAFDTGFNDVKQTVQIVPGTYLQQPFCNQINR